MDALWWIIGFLTPMLLAPLRAEFNWAGAAFGRWVGFAVADVWWGLRWVAETMYGVGQKEVEWSISSEYVRELQARVQRKADLFEHEEALRRAGYAPSLWCECGFCRKEQNHW